MEKRNWQADGLLLLTASIWGFAFVAQRVGMESVGPYTYNGVRFALGSVSLLPLIAYGRRCGGPKPAVSWLRGGLLAGAVLFVGASLQQVGLMTTTAGKAGFITGLYVVIVPLLGLFWRQRPAAGTWLGAFLAVIGLYLLSVTGDFTVATGDVLELAGAFFWAGHVLLIGWFSPRTDVLKLASVQCAVCSLFSLATAFAIETVTLQGIVAAALPILYGGLFSVGIAYTLQVVAQRHAPPAHTAILLSLEGTFAALGGWLILGESLSLRGLLGAALMLAGMLCSQLAPRSATTEYSAV